MLRYCMLSSTMISVGPAVEGDELRGPPLSPPHELDAPLPSVRGSDPASVRGSDPASVRGSDPASVRGSDPASRSSGSRNSTASFSLGVDSRASTWA